MNRERSPMPRRFSSSATRATWPSKPSAPRTSCSLASNLSPRSRNSFAGRSPRKAGKRTEPSRDACGRYIRMKARMSSRSFRRSSGSVDGHGVRPLEDPPGQDAARAVLFEEDAHEVGERPRLPEAGEDLLFFELFVVLLDEVPDDPAAWFENVRIGAVAVLQRGGRSPRRRAGPGLGGRAPA